MSSSIFRQLIQLAKTETRALIWGTVFLIISSSAALFYPQGIRWLLDHGIATKDTHQLMWVSGILFVVTLVQGTATTLRFWFFVLAGERIVLRLRQNLFSHILNQPISFFDSQRTGDLMSRLSSDCAVIQNAVSVNVSMILRNALQAIGGLILLFYTSAELTLIALILIPPLALGFVILGKKIRVLSRKTQDALALASQTAEEVLSGIRTVRSFAQEEFEKQKYQMNLDSLLRIIRERVVAIAVFISLIGLLASFGLTGMLWWGGNMVIDDRMSIGSLTSFSLYLLMVSIAVGTLGSLWTDFVAAFGASSRVFELLSLPNPKDTEPKKRLQIKAGRLEFQGVSFLYPQRPDVAVLKNVSFVVEPGEVIALVGPSGAGKSTVTSLLLGLYSPSSGDILIDNQSLLQIQPESSRQQIGVVSQEPLLFSSSIAENISYGNPNATSAQIEEVSRLCFVDEFVQRFPDKYKTLVGERGVQLSGGQKQRVAIARAYLKNPRLLILDEATSSLDAESEFQVQRALKVLMKGRTTLLIAHRLASVREASRILVMDKGMIREQGTHQSLLQDKDGLYSHLIQRQLIS